ncbi:hypothetical protein [Bifidobacterium parmae]|uniref:Uridine kinase n=1 Tax=Bifidobacterium parmae TaxID=361854 RepID=A0A2N5IWS6_9BIFI|nr:hypothetical protein [Bifidobacterium parmae]PLS26402.1 uridine kinase [Bifidobacterium parmae]
MIRISATSIDVPGMAVRFAAVMAATLMTLSLMSCTAPSARPAADGAGATDVSAQAGFDDTTDTYPIPTITRRFAACLVSKGFDARVVGERNDQVALLEIDAAGNPKRPKIIDGGDGIITRDWTTDPNLYPNITSTGTISNAVTGDDFPYIIADAATDLAGSPYAARQGDYAACEQANPDFTQGVASTDIDDSHAGKKDKDAVLAFARKARAKGFTWVADPTGDEPLHIVIPDTVPENDVRRFFKECPADGVPVIFSWIGDYPYDTNAVQQGR